MPKHSKREKAWTHTLLGTNKTLQQCSEKPFHSDGEGNWEGIEDMKKNSVWVALVSSKQTPLLSWATEMGGQVWVKEVKPFRLGNNLGIASEVFWSRPKRDERPKQKPISKIHKNRGRKKPSTVKHDNGADRSERRGSNFAWRYSIRISDLSTRW